jgi:rSAM/selenodomain-associated transferase 1
MIRRHLVLFARAPRLGSGKRRLARDIGAVGALRFERLMLTRLLRSLGRDGRWRLRVAVTPDRARRRKRLWPPGIALAGQGRSDLGHRMRRALAACPPGRAVLIGTDIPALARDHIAEAFRLLGRHDVVFGPAADGGFWLVGARRRPRLQSLFERERVRWSSPQALADTLAGLPRGLAVGFVETLADVDDGADYRNLPAPRGF